MVASTIDHKDRFIREIWQHLFPVSVMKTVTVIMHRIKSYINPTASELHVKCYRESGDTGQGQVKLIQTISMISTFKINPSAHNSTNSLYPILIVLPIHFRVVVGSLLYPYENVICPGQQTIL